MNMFLQLHVVGVRLFLNHRNNYVIVGRHFSGLGIANGILRVSRQVVVHMVHQTFQVRGIGQVVCVHQLAIGPSYQVF